MFSLNEFSLVNRQVSLLSHDKLSRKSMMSKFQAMSSDSGMAGLETAW